MKLTKNELINLYTENLVLSDKGIKWQEIFENEVEMLETLAELTKVKMFQGNTWLNIAKNAIEKGWTLSDKQLTQVKRNAYLIAKLANYNLPEYENFFK